MPATAPAILFVDDEQMILRSLERLFADSPYRVLTTDDAAEAIGIIGREEIAVIVSDERMPKMKGIELLERVRNASPETVKILLTAHADLATAEGAINKGEVFRFVRKPWDGGALQGLVREAVARFERRRAQWSADEATLLALAETIELKDPLTQGHCKRVAQYALWIAEALNIPEEVRRRIRFGAWLHDCGKIGVPESVLNYPGALNALESELIRNHPQWGAQVVRLANMGPEIVNIVLCHHERYDGTGYPQRIRAEAIPLEARIVAIADMYDAVTSDRPYMKKVGRPEAVRMLQLERGRALDPGLTDRFISILAAQAELRQ